MRLPQLLLFTISLVPFVSSLTMYDSHVAASCIYFFRKLNWDCSAAGGHMSSSTWQCQCRNIDWLGSMTNCIHDYANSTREMNHAYEHIVGRCNGKAMTDYTVDDMKAYQLNATRYLVDSKTYSKTDNITAPMYIEDATFQPWWHTFREWNYWVSMCERLGWVCVGFWISVIVLAGIYNYIGYKYVSYETRQKFNKHLTYKHDWGLFGLNRLEAFICFMFFVLVILCSSIGYDLDVNSYLYNQWFLTLDSINYRTDIIAFSLMPVIYLMGIRNNPFQYFGWWPHSTMIKFHKFVAIIFSILALIHSVIWTYYAGTADGGGYAVWAADEYFYWGIIGSIVLGLMLCLSIEFFRNLFYECFLLFHKAFSVLFVAAMWKHCETLGWMGWVYSMAAILAFDRVCRIFRICQNGFANTVKIDAFGDDLIKLEFVEPVGFGFYPGSYVYLTFLTPVYMSWQSHPFSLIRSTKASNRLVLYLKCKKGLTKKLAKLANRDTIKVLIDGPYGKIPVQTSDDSGFDKVIGIAGGLGIASVLTFFNHRLNKGKSILNYRLNWLINDMKQVELVKDNLQWLSNNGMDVTVYYTRYQNNTKETEKAFETVNNGEKSDTSSTADHSHDHLKGLDIKYGKPSIDELLPKESTLKRRIYSCCPEGLTKSILTQLSDLDEFFNENHTW